VAPLLELTAAAPDPDAIRPLLSAVGAELTLAEGLVRLSCTLDTPRGPVTFH
jgi:hypothetical protein